MNKATALLALASLVFAAPVFAQPADYLQSQFDWVTYINAHRVDHYLNYAGSRLTPVVEADVTFEQFPGGQLKPYERLWYHHGAPLAMRRQLKLAVEKDSIGAIIIRPTTDGDSVRAAANAALRIAAEARVNRTTVAAVFVPDEIYGDVMNALQRYDFATKPPQDEGEQFSITLKCASDAREDQLFYQRK